MYAKIALEKRETKNKEQKSFCPISNNVNVLSFLLVVVTSIYLRLPGIYHGMPNVFNPEESRNILKLLHIFKHFFSLGSLEISPVYLYLSSLIVYFTGGSPDIETVLKISPETLYVPLRFLSVLFGVGSVIVVYFIGCLFNSLVGVFASGFLAVSLLSVVFSQMFLPVNGMLFFSLLSVYFALRALSSIRLNLFFSTLFALISASINIFGAVSFIPALMVLFLRKDFSRFKFLFGVFMVFCLIFNPQLVFNFVHLVRSVIINYLSSKHNSYFLYSFSLLVLSVGPIVWVTSLCLPLFKMNYNKDTLYVLFSLPLFYLGVLGLFHLNKVSYVVLLIPFLCLASGLFFSSLYEKVLLLRDSGAGVPWFVFILLLLFAFYIPLKYSFRYNKTMKLSDTRQIATEWINENASGKVKIVWDKNSIQPKWFYPYNKRELEKLGIAQDVLQDRREFIVNSKLLGLKGWHRILKKRVDYVVVNSLDEQNVLRRPGNLLKKKYYSKIQKSDPVITFNPYLRECEKQIGSFLIEDLYSPYLTLWKRERPGPVIKIYKV